MKWLGCAEFYENSDTRILLMAIKSKKNLKDVGERNESLNKVVLKDVFKATTKEDGYAILRVTIVLPFVKESEKLYIRKKAKLNAVLACTLC